MEQTSLIQLLRLLDTRTRTRLKHYVHSPFFNRHEGLKRLADWILGFAPEFKHPHLTKEKAWPVVAPGKPYDALRVNNHLSNLTQLAYGFLAQLELEKQPALKQIWALQGLQERQADTLLDRNLRRADQLLEQADARSADYRLLSWQLQAVKDRAALYRQQRKYSPFLHAQNDELDAFFWCSKLRLACEMVSRSGVIQTGYKATFLDILKQGATATPVLSENPVVQLYLAALKMLEEGQEADYEVCSALLQRNRHLISIEERYNLYHYLLNFCIRQINSGTHGYYRQAFRQYQNMLRDEVLLINGALSQWSFKNIITTGIRLGELEWVSHFMETYQVWLPEEDRVNALAFNRAALHYAWSDYGAALTALQAVDFTDDAYYLGAKIIQLKSYFELRESAAFFALIQSFEQYLRRNPRLSDYRRTANLNFLHLVRKAFELKPGTREAALWVTSVQQTYPLANKDWLLQIPTSR
jgi:hypothetical protein